jgi:hypothetical protein
MYNWFHSVLFPRGRFVLFIDNVQRRSAQGRRDAAISD